MSCLLGFEDELIGKDSTDFKVNKVGGKPDWASGNYQNPDCKLCGKSMPLAVQVYAPLDGSRNHRTLYLFCCVQQKCHIQHGGWICLRDETLDNSYLTQASTVNSLSTLPSASAWVEDADDWGDDKDEWDDKNNDKGPIEESMMETIHSENFLEKMEKFNLEEANMGSKMSEISEEEAILPTAEVDEVDASVTLDDIGVSPSVNLRSLLMPSETTLEETSHLVFHSFYLSVSEEELTKGSNITKLDQRAKQLLQEYQQKEKCDWTKASSKQQGSSGTDETYEKSRPTHGDEIVHKFVSRVQAYPEQLIRYEREGTPLLYKTLSKYREACKCCGSVQVFELQLMPHLGQKLSLQDEAEVSCPIEIATVLIFTCPKSCWSDTGLREESVIVQAEMY